MPPSFRDPRSIVAPALPSDRIDDLTEFRAALRDLKKLWDSARPTVPPDAASVDRQVEWFRAELMAAQAKLYRLELHRRLAAVDDRMTARLRSAPPPGALHLRQAANQVLDQHRSRLLDEIVRVRPAATSTDAD